MTTIARAKSASSAYEQTVRATEPVIAIVGEHAELDATALRGCPAGHRKRQIDADDPGADALRQFTQTPIERLRFERANARVERRHDDEHRCPLPAVHERIKSHRRHVGGGKGKLGCGRAGLQCRPLQRHRIAFERHHTGALLYVLRGHLFPPFEIVVCYVKTSSSRLVSRAMTISIAMRSPTDTSRPQR